MRRGRAEPEPVPGAAEVEVRGVVNEAKNAGVDDEEQEDRASTGPQDPELYDGQLVTGVAGDSAQREEPEQELQSLII